ncbi:hypothetical protein [Vibrio marisflavi]|uniref:hypothetical protein n=1 Tax=Vibrio marisflavi TaxID=1216040 RepID=UPI001F217874|nr:hypothetical protein [Vibrio marisflavi]
MLIQGVGTDAIWMNEKKSEYIALRLLLLILAIIFVSWPVMIESQFSLGELVAGIAICWGILISLLYLLSR